MQLSFFKNQQQKEFSEMTKPEKKRFLENDLIERMIHVEQKVRGSMGEGLVPYYQTNYFKELHPEEKRRFIAYLKSKQTRKKWRFLPWVLILGFGAFAGFNFTGNVVANDGGFSPMSISLIVAFVIAIIVYLLHLSAKKERARKMNSHVAVIDNILAKRRFRRN